MIRSTTHIENLDDINSIDIDESAKAWVATLKSDIASEATDKTEWNKKIEILRDLRYGYRAPKTVPFKNCANYSIPLIDSHIQKLKSTYINLFYNASPVVNFEPYGAEDIDPAKKREQLFDWRMRTKVDFFKDYCIGVDKMLEQGQIVFKIVWNYSTRSYQEFLDIEDLSPEVVEALLDERVDNDMLFTIISEELGVDLTFEENIKELLRVVKEFRDGEEKFEMTLLELENNQPSVTACDVKEDLVIPRDTIDIQDARFIDHKIWMTTNDIKIAMEDGKYAKYADSDIESWGSKSGMQGNGRGSVGVSTENEIILLHEVCCWYDTNDDGIKERAIVTYPDTDESSILRFIEIPYDHGKFPYEQVRRELNDPLFYTSRGICELDEDFQRGITNAMNQAEDFGTITNVPVIVTRKNTVLNVRNRKYTPGEVIETIGDPNDYQIRQPTNVAQPAILQFSQYLKSWSDQRVGDVSAGLGGQANLSGQSQTGQKTKAEISLISTLSQSVTSLDALIFQMQMAKVYCQIDALYDQYGDDEEEILITGEAPQKITRKEIQGKYNMVPNGRLENTNPAMRVAIATTALQVGANDPDVKQDELKKFYYDSIDPRLSKKLLYTKEEKNQLAKQVEQRQEALKNAALKQGLDLEQIKIMLDVQKEAMLMPIEVKKEIALADVQGMKYSKFD